MKKPILVLLIILAVALSGCSGGGLTKEEKQYYKGLDASNVKLGGSKMEEYINIYVTYLGHIIPDDKLAVIKEMTDEKYFESTVRNRFINTMSAEGFYDVNSTQQAPLEVKPRGAPEENKDNLIQSDINDNKASALEIFYVYRDNTYVAKVLNAAGKVSYLFFKVDDIGKVVDIYA